MQHAKHETSHRRVWDRLEWTSTIGKLVGGDKAVRVLLEEFLPAKDEVFVSLVLGVGSGPQVSDKNKGEIDDSA